MNFGQATPYFHPLATMEGSVLTDRRPLDHPHHRGLRFAWKKINGLEGYWSWPEEQVKFPDKAMGHSDVTAVKVAAHDDFSARFELEMSYHLPGEPADLTEKRIIEVSAPGKNGSYQIDWHSVFTGGPKGALLDRTPIPGEEGGKWFGGYAGLQFRLAHHDHFSAWTISNCEGTSVTSKANAISAETRKNLEPLHGKPARRVDLTLDMADGKTGGVTIMDHPGNLRHPSPWHIAAMPHEFHHAPLFSGPYTLEAGKKLPFQFRILVHSGPLQKQEMGGQWKDFIGQPPNILFILVDDMGWRDLACYGREIHETPNIDKFASGGMRFTDGYAACPVCGPTRASIMSGKFPSRSGFTANWLPPDDDLLWNDSMPKTRPAFMKLEEITLAEALKAGGYQTAFVGKWHLGKEPYYPQHQGFDINVAGNHWGHPRKGYFSPYQMEHLVDGPRGEYLTDRLTSEAIRVMDDFSRKGKPWLMYMSYYTVHAPFHAKAETVKKYKEKARQANVKLNANYAAMVESLDENVGHILRWLDEKELRKDTIIVFTSDNGGFHMATTNRPLRGYKGSLYDGGIRVPWIVQWPGVTKPGSICNKPVISSDFYPTLLEMTGLPLRPKQHLDGVSLVPLLKGEADFDRGPLVWFYPHYLPRHHAEPGSAIRIGDWKLIQYYEDERQELYNLKRDIGESDNLAKRMPERVVEMKAQLDAMLKEHGAKIPAPDPAYRKK